MKPTFISTAIPYVNAPGHVGHALEFIQTDVIARYYRSLKRDVFFLTGTDENSLKNAKAAEQQGVSTKDLVDRNAAIFRSLADKLKISYDDFIRTTEPKHIKGAQKLWLACEDDIYQKTYRGLYCVGCEEFYQESELEDGKCPEHHTEPEVVEEENYFFRLSKYQEQLKAVFEKDIIKIIPSSRKNEIVSFLNSGLEDICISRSVERAKGWGIPVPGDNTQIIWVWFDALSNYINALGYGENDKKFEEFWQKSDAKVHVIGKGIARFHAIYWPGILLSAGISLPSTIFVHGYITVDGQKMSKSIGNVIDPFELVEKYGVDAVRYFFLREIPPTEDGDFSFEKFETRYNADLASGLGNLVARTLALAKKQQSTINNQQFNNSDFQKLVDETKKNVDESLEEFRFNDALVAIWDIIHACDKYVDEKRPWEVSKGQKEVIADLLLAGSHIAELLQPFLPETSEKIQQQLQSGQSEPLFPRIQ